MIPLNLLTLNQKIEKQVVGSYRKIEKVSVEGFQKIADTFVGAYLAKEGELIEDARARLAQEKAEREETTVQWSSEHMKKH